MSYTDILKIVPTMQSVAVASNAYRLVKKKKKKTGDFVNTGVSSIVGAAMIKEESDFLGGF